MKREALHRALGQGIEMAHVCFSLWTARPVVHWTGLVEGSLSKPDSWSVMSTWAKTHLGTAVLDGGQVGIYSPGEVARVSRTRFVWLGTIG